MASPTKEIQKAAYSIADLGKNNTGTEKSKTSGRLFFLDAGGGRVFSANPDGSDLKVIISEGRIFPDGLVVDTTAGHIYWTNMGNPVADDGSINTLTGGTELDWFFAKSGSDRITDHATGEVITLLRLP